MEFIDHLTRGWGSDHRLTLMAAHPGGNVRVRHVDPNDRETLTTKLEQLLAANEQGWHAWVAVNPRPAGITEPRRGGLADLPCVTTLAVDIDRPYHLGQIARALGGLVAPSAVVKSGRGTHLYWWVQPMRTRLGDRITRALAAHLGGDQAITAAANLRLPGSRNLKYGDVWAEAVYTSPHRYRADDFAWVTPAVFPAPQPHRRDNRSRDLNPALVNAVAAHLMHHYDGVERGNYIQCRCPLGHHHEDRGDHFSFDTERGLGRCFGKHGRALLYQVCRSIHLDVNQYGGIYA